MKVVLFCGGYGMRMRDDIHDVPKPMTEVGGRPLIWHVMRYYAHFGHKDFILAMGYGARHIKQFFLDYSETDANDFVLSKGGRRVKLLGQDINDWTISFIDTGLDSSIGERLRRVAPYLQGEKMFMANYADVLTNSPLDRMVQRFEASTATACMLAVPPQSAFHVIELQDGLARRIHSVSEFPIVENGGYFIFRPEILDQIAPGEDLVGDVLTRLAPEGKVLAYEHTGFWMPADTVKERSVLNSMYEKGDRPWMVWQSNDRKTSGRK